MQASLSQITSLPQKDKVSRASPPPHTTHTALTRPSARAQTQAYLSLLSSTIADSSSARLGNFVLFLDAILSDSLAQIVARPCLTEYVEKLEGLDKEARMEVMAMSIPKMQPRVTSFEEQVRDRKSVV